ncbi:MAG: hypothetical protein RIR18_560 [Pseudomonadota bacterium]|jgi:uncharacterized DUF497 family protein
MKHRLIWDETKRRSNFAKHGLDFRQAEIVLSANYRLDRVSVRKNEARMQSFAYVMNHLAVLTVVHTQRGDAIRVISFRTASEAESRIYYDWIAEVEN